GDGECNNDCAANVAQEEEENNHHQDDSLGQIVQHGVGGEVEQLASVDEGNDLHSLGQNLIVQFLYFLMDGFQYRLRVVAFLQHCDPRYDIVVIDDFSVFPFNCLAKLAQADLRALGDDGNVLHLESRAGLGHDDGA